MSSRLLNSGDLLPLSLTLDGGDTDKFPMAWIYDQNNTQLPGSPVVLVHHQFGRYVNNSYVVPAGVTHITALYRIFDDAGHTQLSLVYPNCEDFFDITGIAGSVSGVDAAVDLLNKIIRSDYPGSGFSGAFGDVDKLTGSIGGTSYLDGFLLDDGIATITGIIGGTGYLTGILIEE